jgi:signal transduction histidine kinase
MVENDSQQLSGKLFYRVYFVLVICIILIGTFLDSFINQTEIEQDSHYLKKLYKPAFVLISERLKNTSSNQWKNEITQLSSLLEFPINLFHIEDFSTNQEFISSLSNTNIIGLYDENDSLSLYMRVENSQYIIEIETLKKGSNKGMRWIPIVFYLLIALVLFILVQPFARQLLQLRAAAIRFGKGNFSTRITMPKSSTLYPITDAFDTMTREIESLMLRQRDLTNAVSHELRTPLARLKFSFELLESSISDEKTLEDINHMRDDVDELELLVNEMLCYAEANQIKDYAKNNIIIIEFIDKILNDIEPNGLNLVKNIHKSIHPKTIIHGDEFSLIRALSNIIRNSISFAESTCHTMATVKNNTLSILISDDGPGIDEKFKNQLFDPFFKIDNIKRKSGSGLGLAIAKTIIKKHKGSIQIVNGELKGACFEIKLPLAKTLN